MLSKNCMRCGAETRNTVKTTHSGLPGRVALCVACETGLGVPG